MAEDESQTGTASGQSEPMPAALKVLRRITIGYLAFLVAALFLSALIPQTWPLWLTFRLVTLQDTWLMAAGFVLAALALQPIWPSARIPRLDGWRLAGIGLAVVLGCYAGFYLVLGAYDITRDEQMAAFDSLIFAQGRLVWPIPPEWQLDAKALNIMFMLPVDYPAAWVSAYLPGNALLRTLVGTMADPAFSSPLLAAASLPALLGCARRIWPDDRETSSVVLLLLLGSGQFLLNAMSSYAMPAHLFFNMAWLWLFLADRHRTDLAALVIGVVATGLHQPLFHPMFVAPFLLMLLIERRWSRLALFTVGYAVIGAGWMAWPGLIQGMVVGPHSVVAVSGTDYVTRLIDALTVNSDNLALMGANLLRFCTWQHLLTAPLMLVGIYAAQRNRLALALALGLILPTLVMGLILPWQGNGFGYRYLHGVIGNAVLLAGFGWRWVAQEVAGMRPAFMRATLGTFLVLVPLQIWMSHERYAPFAAANRAIDASGADYAVIEAGNGFSFGSMIYNRPDLSNRPIRLLAETVPDPDRLARRICKPGVTVAMAGNGFFRPGAAYFRVSPQDTADAGLPALRAPYERAGCRIVIMN